MPQLFAELLTEGVHRIRLRTSKSIQAVQDDLGHALGRKGGSAVEYWRKGHLPPTLSDIERLAQTIVRQGRLDRGWLEKFLRSANYPDPLNLCEALFPAAAGSPTPSSSNNGTHSIGGNHTWHPADLPRAGNGLPAAEASIGTVNEAVEDVSGHPAFIAGPPILHPCHFFGRRSVLKYLFTLWEHFPLQHVAIVGPPRTGKTSLLQYLSRLPGAPAWQMRPGQHEQWLGHSRRYRWVLIDFQDARMRSQERVLRHVLSTLHLPVPEPCDLSAFLDIVNERLRVPAIIMMDELGAALSSPELDEHFWCSLSSLSTHHLDGKLGYVLTSPEAPAEVAGACNKRFSFFNIFGHILRLGPFTEEEALELIASSSRPFSPETVDWILSQSGRWPSLLQMLCHAHWVACENGEPGEGWKYEGLRRIAPYRHLLEA